MANTKKTFGNIKLARAMAKKFGPAKPIKVKMKNILIVERFIRKINRAFKSSKGSRLIFK